MSRMLAFLALIEVRPGSDIKGVVYAAPGRAPLTIQATLDYDAAAADTVIADLTTQAILDTNRRIKADLTTGNDPEIEACITHIEIVFPAVEISTLTQEQWWNLTKDLELLVTPKSGTVQRYEIANVRAGSQATNSLDSDLATATAFHNHGAHRALIPLRFPVAVDLKSDTVAIVTSATGTTAASNGLAGNTEVQVNVWGAFVDHAAKGLAGEGKSCGPAAAEAAEIMKPGVVQRMR